MGMYARVVELIIILVRMSIATANFQQRYVFVVRKFLVCLMLNKSLHESDLRWFMCKDIPKNSKHLLRAVVP